MDYLSNCITDFYIKEKIIDSSDKEVYRAGVDLILNELFTFLLVILLSTLVSKLVYSIIFTVVFFTTRVFCGGFHAKKVSICRGTMLFTFLNVIILSQTLCNFPKVILYLILLISLLIILPLIPVKHPNKIMTDEMIKSNRKKGIMVYTGFSVAVIIISEFISQEIANVIGLSLLSVSILAVIGSYINERGCYCEKNPT